MSSERVLGLVLVALGAMLLVVMTTDVGAEAVVAVIGAGFLIAYIATRNYGFLVPGGILTGLGTGLILASAGWSGDAVLLGLGAGFVSIAVVDLLVSKGSGAWWWPLIPGAILMVIGATAIPGLEDLSRFVVPAALVVIGIALLMRRPSRS